MRKPNLTRIVLFVGLALTTITNSGCTMIFDWFIEDTAFAIFNHFGMPPVIPVSAWASQQVEDGYWEEERYGRVPILDPVEGENAPIACLDPPSKDEVIRALPDDTAGGLAFIAETSRSNVRIVVELIVDRLDDAKFYPMVGPARHHHCHYKCTVFYDKTIRSNWPVPFTHTDQTQEVVYIDHNHLIRVAGPQTN